MNLDLQTIKNTAMWVLIAVAVIGIVLAIIIKKIVGKIITLVLAALIVFFGWQQRVQGRRLRQPSAGLRRMFVTSEVLRDRRDLPRLL